MKLNIVPARTGLQWVKAGARTFFRQPLALGGLFFMFMGAVSLLALVPVLGNILALALLPAATLGLMAAAKLASEGVFPMPRVLGTAFAAGKQRMTSMLKLGGLYAGSMLTLLAFTALFDGGQFASIYLGRTELTQELAETDDFQQAVWVAMAFYLPLAAAFWHAPALVHWHGLPAGKSLFFSLLACWRNKGALVVFGLGWVGMFVLGSVVTSVLVSLLGGGALARGLVMPAVMLMASMFFSSLYFTFQDSFLTDEPASESKSGA